MSVGLLLSLEIWFGGFAPDPIHVLPTVISKIGIFDFVLSCQSAGGQPKSRTPTSVLNGGVKVYASNRIMAPEDENLQLIANLAK